MDSEVVVLGGSLVSFIRGWVVLEYLLDFFFLFFLVFDLNVICKVRGLLRVRYDLYL